MTRTIWIGIFVFLLLLIDFYVFNAIKQLIRQQSDWNQKFITVLYWSVPVISLLVFFSAFFWFNERLSFKYRNFMASFVFIIYISKLFAAVILLFGDILKLGKILLNKIYQLFLTESTGSPNSGNGNTINRSEFIAKTALAVGGLHIGAMGWGIISGAHDYRIRKVKLALNNLPSEFDGLKLIQISDIHSGSFFNKTAVKGGVEMLMAENPDMVFFTGDLVNNNAEEFKEYFNIFNKIKAPLGVYSTLGNHDYGDYAKWESEQQKIQNIKDLMEAHRLMGWNLLMDENKAITIGNQKIGILGIQNWGVGFAQYGSLEKALKNTHEFDTKLLLSHDPSHWRAQVLQQTDIDASFAGHTHGMQYGVEIGDFKWSPAQFRYKEWAGLYQENDQQLYVNRGYGFLGYPGRLGILPEITVFELGKKNT